MRCSSANCATRSALRVPTQPRLIPKRTITCSSARCGMPISTAKFQTGASISTSAAASCWRPSSRARAAAPRKSSATPTCSRDRPARRGVRGASRAWDVLMLNARRQAEHYARALPVSHGWPPFILVCDVGHVLEVYADFSGQGKNYAQFPDRQSFRIYLEDLRQPEAPRAADGHLDRSDVARSGAQGRRRSRVPSPNDWPWCRRRWKPGTIRRKRWRCS